MAKTNRFVFLFVLCFLLVNCSPADKAKLSSLAGYLAWKQNDWNGAASNFFKTLELGDGTNDKEIGLYANYGIASTYLMQNEDTSAVLRLRNITDVQDRNLHASVLYQLGIISFKAQKYREAVSFFKQSLELEPGSVDAKINYELSKRYSVKKEAETADRKTVKSSGNNEEAVFDRTITELIKKKENARWHNTEQEEKPIPFDY